VRESCFVVNAAPGIIDIPGLGIRFVARVIARIFHQAAGQATDHEAGPLDADRSLGLPGVSGGEEESGLRNKSDPHLLAG